MKRVRGGLLVQQHAPAVILDEGWRVVTERQPSDHERRNLLFAWRAVASVKSNAIVLARDGATIGIGAGQMSRVDAAFLATHKARNAGHNTAGSALDSFAFWFVLPWLVWAAFGLLIVGLIVGWIMKRAGYGVGGAKYTPKEH